MEAPVSLSITFSRIHYCRRLPSLHRLPATSTRPECLDPRQHHEPMAPGRRGILRVRSRAYAVAGAYLFTIASDQHTDPPYPPKFAYTIVYQVKQGDDFVAQYIHDFVPNEDNIREIPPP
jgi:hypothetical protein